MIRAKKSLGQNFLIDKNILKKIVSIKKIEDKSILEIGPGTGNLTSYILKNRPKKLFVVEKDKDLAILLKKRFEDKIIIINDMTFRVNFDFNVLANLLFRSSNNQLLSIIFSLLIKHSIILILIELYLVVKILRSI